MIFNHQMVDFQPANGRKSTMYPRHMLKQVRDALADSPVTLIHGARQVGKTTMVRDLLGGPGGFRYISLDSSSVLGAARADPEGLIAGFDDPVAIDEIQREPELLRAIKARVDADRRPGRFLLTGSANVLALPRVSESLAGRMEIVRLWPLSQGESSGVREGFVDAVFAPRLRLPSRVQESRQQLLARAERGGFPEALKRASPERRTAWFDSYLTSILQRDVRDLSNIEGLTIMPRLMRLLASRLGGLLNYADLGRSLSMPQSTLKRYFALLEMTFLVRLIEPWSANLGLRLVKSPRAHLIDTGLACSLLGLDEVPSAHPVVGPLLESLVAMELTKQLGWSKVRARLLHFRTQAGKEVDFVLENPSADIVGIEVKASGAVTRDDFRGIEELRRLSGDRFVRGIVLYGGAETLSFGDRLVATPIGSVWTPAG